MKRAAWFIVSELLLVLTIVLVFSNWHGTAGFSFAWPLSASTVNISGSEQGARVLLAFICALLTIATFLLGLLRLFSRGKSATSIPARPSTVPPPTSPPPTATNPKV